MSRTRVPRKGPGKSGASWSFEYLSFARGLPRWYSGIDSTLPVQETQ